MMAEWRWLILVVLIFVASWFVGKTLQQTPTLPMQVMQIAPCQLTGAGCAGKFADTGLQIKFSPPVSVMKPFGVVVTSTAELSEIILEFRMQGMDMGMQPFHLQKNEQGVWQTDVILPVCTLSRSDWLMEVQVKYRDQWWRGGMEFLAGVD